MYRIIEVARMLGVSKVTVYKKINKNKKLLKNHVHIRSNISYVDDEGVEIIKNTIEASLQNQDLSEIEIKREAIEHLKMMVDLLNQQITEKKNQIHRKDDLIESYKVIAKSNRGKIQYLESKIKPSN